MGLFNLTSDVGEVGRTDPTRLDEAMGLLQELRELRRNDDVPAIREELAKGLVNLITSTGQLGRTDGDKLVQAEGLLMETVGLAEKDPREQVWSAVVKASLNLAAAVGNGHKQFYSFVSRAMILGTLEPEFLPVQRELFRQAGIEDDAEFEALLAATKQHLSTVHGDDDEKQT
ncbi:MAG: hypothetical protein AAGI46_15190 [Planctomycetota bacterium]